MVVVAMMVMVVMVMMVMVMFGRRFGGLRRRPGRGGGRGGFLRDGVTGEADSESGRDDKTLDHGRTFLWLGNPNGSRAKR